MDRTSAQCRKVRTLSAIGVIVALCLVAAARAEDWPQWRGPHRDAAWHENGILDSFRKVTEPSSGASIHLTAAPSIHRVFLYTDRGDLILSRVTADGYQEISRSHLLEPTSDLGGRKMAWSPLAYANRCVFGRNDKELVCASLASD